MERFIADLVRLRQADMAEDYAREILALLKSTRNAVLGRQSAR